MFIFIKNCYNIYRRGSDAMDYEYINMGSYNLHIIKTKKFKTVTVEVNFYNKMNKDDITKRNLLKSVLLNCNNTFKTEKELIRETENLYDLKLISSNNRIGNYSNLSFRVKFLNEKYTEEDMNRYSIEFLFDILFNPFIKDNKFDEEVVKKCKKSLKKSIESLKDNKLKYAIQNLLKSTKDMPYSYSMYGNIDDLEKINSSNLYDYYKTLFVDNYIDVFVLGDVDSDNIKEIFRNKFMATTFKKRKELDVVSKELNIRKRIKKIVEQCDANQSQLTMLCNMNDLSTFERKYVLLAYNEMLGGGSHSILFNNVREKKSYAYYINSIIKSYDNLLLIYSGIENGNSVPVIKLVRKCLADISKGKFLDADLESAKENIIASIKASKDSTTGIINSYFAKVIVNSLDFDERISKIKSITRDDIIDLSKKIHVHTVYLLEGDNNEGN